MRFPIPLLLLALLFIAGAAGCSSKKEEPAAVTTASAPPASYPEATSPDQKKKSESPKGKQRTFSGLEYEVLRTGTGRRPTRYNKVKVHYHGYLPDGTVFDSSVQRGQPATFGLDRVIPGWTEGIQLMKEGAKYRFTIPPNLAYGKEGSPPKIGPNQTLIFDVELIEVVY